MVRQTEFFSKALSMRLLEATEECIKKDGFVNESSMSMALSKLVSSHLAMVTENLSRKYEKEVLAMFFKTWSPMSWPKRSLIPLNLSASTSRRVVLCSSCSVMRRS